MRLKPFAIAIFEEERRQTARGGQVELKLSVRPLKMAWRGSGLARCRRGDHARRGLALRGRRRRAGEHLTRRHPVAVGGSADPRGLRRHLQHRSVVSLDGGGHAAVAARGGPVAARVRSGLLVGVAGGPLMCLPCVVWAGSTRGVCHGSVGAGGCGWSRVLRGGGGGRVPSHTS
jgi:hypothetical protein